MNLGFRVGSIAFWRDDPRTYCQQVGHTKQGILGKI